MTVLPGLLILRQRSSALKWERRHNVRKSSSRLEDLCIGLGWKEKGEGKGEEFGFFLFFVERRPFSARTVSRYCFALPAPPPAFLLFLLRPLLIPIFSRFPASLQSFPHLLTLSCFSSVANATSLVFLLLFRSLTHLLLLFFLFLVHSFLFRSSALYRLPIIFFTCVCNRGKGFPNPQALSYFLENSQHFLKSRLCFFLCSCRTSLVRSLARFLLSLSPWLLPGGIFPRFSAGATIARILLILFRWIFL